MDAAARALAAEPLRAEALWKTIESQLLTRQQRPTH
jgi:hypothetical protein